MHEKKDRKEYMREYHKKYRQDNKERLKKIRLDYYKRTLEKEKAQEQQEQTKKELVDCLKCKHHYWKRGHMWTCTNQKANVILDIKTGLVVCPYFVKKEE